MLSTQRLRRSTSDDDFSSGTGRATARYRHDTKPVGLVDATRADDAAPDTAAIAVASRSLDHAPDQSAMSATTAEYPKNYPVFHSSGC
ncbi:hypothetical protein ALI22I_07605 [Saccharothrix sp. ALI-22-I]|nr:hypothetical protein ALI22I_07605 [Saccharothrix sp. ALI-22-I]